MPPATEPLDQIDHVLVGKAGEVCRTDPPASEPIREIDDRLLWKVKIGRWRARCGATAPVGGSCRPDIGERATPTTSIWSLASGPGAGGPITTECTLRR